MLEDVNAFYRQPDIYDSPNAQTPEARDRPPDAGKERGYKGKIQGSLTRSTQRRKPWHGKWGFILREALAAAT